MTDSGEVNEPRREFTVKTRVKTHLRVVSWIYAASCGEFNPRRIEIRSGDYVAGISENRHCRSRPPPHRPVL